MSKAFSKERDNHDDDLDGDIPGLALPSGVKNYITPSGYRKLLTELDSLLKHERPKVVEAVHWAAKNGDRSENGDYLYGKKRLREIDRRIRFLGKRIDCAVQVDPSVHHSKDLIFFGATVLYQTEAGQKQRITILGIDEADNQKGEVSWISPIAKALLGASAGDCVRLQTPQGWMEIEILRVDYPAPAKTHL